jgi:hypothetical protein
MKTARSGRSGLEVKQAAKVLNSRLTEIGAARAFYFASALIRPDLFGLPHPVAKS